MSSWVTENKLKKRQAAALFLQFQVKKEFLWCCAMDEPNSEVVAKEDSKIVSANTKLSQF